jgi:hypothetical protein
MKEDALQSRLPVTINGNFVLIILALAYLHSFLGRHIYIDRGSEGVSNQKIYWWTKSGAILSAISTSCCSLWNEERERILQKSFLKVQFKSI